MPRVLGADSMLNLMTWVDTEYAVNNDIIIHIGSAISFRTGVIMCKSTKQKLSTKISTEPEVV